MFVKKTKRGCRIKFQNFWLRIRLYVFFNTDVVHIMLCKCAQDDVEKREKNVGKTVKNYIQFFQNILHKLFEYWVIDTLINVVYIEIVQLIMVN